MTADPTDFSFFSLLSVRGTLVEEANLGNVGACLKVSEIKAISISLSLSPKKEDSRIPSELSTPVWAFGSLSVSLILESSSCPRAGVWARPLVRNWSVFEGAIVGVPLTASRTIRSIVEHDILKVSSVTPLRRLYTWDSVNAIVGCPTGNLNASASSECLLSKALLRPDSWGSPYASTGMAGILVSSSPCRQVQKPDSYPPISPWFHVYWLLTLQFKDVKVRCILSRTVYSTLAQWEARFWLPAG